MSTSSDFYKNLPMLVTGGAGFVGSHISEKLVELGADVTILDNLSSGSTENIDHIKDDITFINEDITDFDSCLRATKNQAFIFHLAAVVSVPESLEKPDHCFSVNTTGTINLLEAAVSNGGVARFIFSSSSAVYGLSDKPCIEAMPCHPQSPYGMSKLMAERACATYATAHSLETICLRYFNVYGKRQNPFGQYAAVVAKFRKLMAENQPIMIFGDGSQTRDFISVEKVVNANINLAKLPASIMKGDIFNIASGTSITLLELIEQLKKGFPEYNAPIIFQPAREGDIKFSSADCSKFHSLG